MIQGTEHEDEFSIEQGPLDPVNLTPGDCTEANIALHSIFAEFDSHVVQVRRVRRPEFRRRYSELEWLIGGAFVSCNSLTIFVDSDLGLGGCLLGGAVYSDVYCIQSESRKDFHKLTLDTYLDHPCLRQDRVG